MPDFAPQAVAQKAQMSVEEQDSSSYRLQQILWQAAVNEPYKKSYPDLNGK